VVMTAEAQEKDVVGLVTQEDSRQDVGFDTGLTVLLTDSEGNGYVPPRA